MTPITGNACPFSSYIYRMDNLNNNLATRFWESTRCANAPNHVDLLLRRLAFGQFKNRILQHHVRIPNPVLCSNYLQIFIELTCGPRSPQIMLKKPCWLAELHFYYHILLKTDDSSEQCSKPTELTELLSKCSYIVYYVYQPRNSCRSLPQSRKMSSSSGGNVYLSNPPF